MKITIVSVGKIKEKYLLDGVKEYVKRLGKYTKVEEIVLQDEPIKDKSSDALNEEIKLKEGRKIISAIDPKSYKIILDLRGKMLDSEELAKKFLEIQSYHASNITFVIGGSLGLSKEVLQMADFSISFSKMTFPHQLMKLILVEQIYRAFKINNNETYHK